MNTTERLAREFAGVLKSWITDEQMREVVRRNALPKYVGCCASHDFCDANMAMNAAFTNVMRRDFSYGSDEDSTLFNDAWVVAKRNNFWIDAPPSKPYSDASTTWVRLGVEIRLRKDSYANMDELTEELKERLSGIDLSPHGMAITGETYIPEGQTIFNGEQADKPFYDETQLDWGQ